MFKQLYKLISSTGYENWETAKSSGLDLGINILDIIDVSLGGTTNKSNYGERRKEFLGESYANLSSKNMFVSRLEVASRTIADAFLQCVNVTTSKGGFVAWIVPSRGKNSFVINAKNRVVSGGDNFTIIDIPIVPSQSVKCSVSNFPKIVDGDIAIICEKPAYESVMVAMNTSAGNIDGIEVTGANSVLYELQTRVSRLENSGSLVPKNTVAYFASQTCPSGWEYYQKAKGRYVVAMGLDGYLEKPVGTELKDGENRPTGNHTHAIRVGQHYKANYFKGGDGRTNYQEVDLETKNPSGKDGLSFVDGTNAPYIQLLACIKA